MDKIMKNIVEKLKALIDKNGQAYLSDEPYLTYKELASADSTDGKMAGAIMLALVMGIDKDIRKSDEPEVLSKTIQNECCFNKGMSDRLTEIFLALYSKENADEWKSREFEGLKQFQKSKFCCSWSGFSVWQAGGGSVDCRFEAEIVLKPAEHIKTNEKLTSILSDNAFMTKEAITEHYKKKIGEYLDYEFEEYCTCEDYYQPVVEDFDIDDRINEWCKKNGFVFISCEGNGYDDGYEPSFVNGRY